MKNKQLNGRTWLILCAALLIITHVLFKTPAPIRWLESVWGAGDLITFVGTIVLGYVAYRQTNKANETSDRLLSIEEMRYKLELRPFFMITDYKAYAKKKIDLIKNPDKVYISIAGEDVENDVLCIELALTNTTNSFMTVKYDSAYSVDYEKPIKWQHCMINQKSGIIPIQPGETEGIVLFAPPTFFDNNFTWNRLCLQFTTENRLAQRYAEYVTIYPTSLSNKTVGCSPDDKWFLSMSVEKYSIKRLERSGINSFIVKEEDNDYV